jgi:hypothetical protein
MSATNDGQAARDQPHAVAADPKLSPEKKEEVLDSLEQDARLLDTATAEGMTGGEKGNLQKVLDAKKKLEKDSDLASNPPAGSEAEISREATLEKLDP